MKITILLGKSTKILWPLSMATWLLGWSRERSPKDHPFSKNCTDEYPNDGTHIPGKPLFLGKKRGVHR